MHMGDICTKASRMLRPHECRDLIRIPQFSVASFYNFVTSQEYHSSLWPVSTTFKMSKKYYNFVKEIFVAFNYLSSLWPNTTTFEMSKEMLFIAFTYHSSL